MRPIIFSAPMVRAILDGRKTQTRRVVRACDCNFFGSGDQKDDPSAWGYAFDGPDHHGYAVLARGYDQRYDHGSVSIPCPFGAPGDQLWVREAWRVPMTFNGQAPRDIMSRANMVTYEATPGPYTADGRYRHAQVMPRWASRLVLAITDVRVQRLQDITEEDARAEGVDHMVVPGGATSHVAAFQALWESIHHTRAPWGSNPWVWALTFKLK